MQGYGQAAHLLGQGRPRAFPLMHVCVLVLVSLLTTVPAVAQPTGYQEYYVLGYEEHVWRAFLEINDDPDSEEIQAGEICSTVSLVATADYQVIYYDHWEDGYEADLLHPVQSTTTVYGDRDTGNGGTGSDLLRAGQDINLTSDSEITGTTAITGYVPVAPARNPADLRYDGGDRIISSGGPVDLVHAMWPLNNSWIGGAWEVYSRQAYANSHSYRLPIGENLYKFDADDYGDFRNVFLQLGAFEDNTTVSISNHAGVVNLTLDRGQIYSSMGQLGSSSAPTITIDAGTYIRSNNPVQVGLITGAEGNFQGRFLVVLPDHLWGADYVVPIPGGLPGDEPEVYLFNPNDFPITVEAYDQGIEQSTFVIAPTGQVSATVPYSRMRGGDQIPVDSAARFTSSDGVFGVVVCAGSKNISYDWGFAGIPSKYLTQDYYVSWAPGDYHVPPQNNGSPAWVTPLADETTFYVDFSPLDDVVDQTFTLDVLQQRRIFDPDNDNTGMHIWATGQFAVAWGEDPLTADRSDPYLDLGVAMLPLQQRWLDPVLTLDKSAHPTILPPTGGAVTFTLVAHSYDSPLLNVSFTDTLPMNWTYVPASTHVTYADGSTDDPAPAISDRTLLWDLGSRLDADESMTLTFQAQMTTTGKVGVPVRDGFESDSYAGGQNWTSGWQEAGDDGLPSSGDVGITDTRPFAGSRHLHIQGSDNSISRTFDPSTFTAPVLRLMRQTDSLEDDERFYLDIYDGLQWTPVLTWTGEGQQGTYVQETVALEDYVSDVATIRFRSGSSGVETTDHLYIDEVEVYDAIAASVNVGEAVGEHMYSDVLFNPSDEATVYLGSLNLVKTVSSAEAGIGDTLAYTLTYANGSSSIPVADVTLHDVVPIQHVTFQSASNGYTYSPGSGTITWTLGTLAPGASGDVTFIVKVDDFVADGTVIENRGDINSPLTIKASSNAVHTTIRAPDVAFEKLGPTAASRGQIITYTLHYQNLGGAQATGVTIDDALPVSTTYVAGSLAMNTGSGWTALTDAAGDDAGTYVAPTLTIVPGTIGAGEEGWIRYNVQVDNDLPPGSRILNSATLDRDLDIPRESNLMVTRISDLLIGKEAKQTAVLPGEIIDYVLTYENTSRTSDQTEVYVHEAIPSYTSLVPGTVSGGDQVAYSWDNGASWTPTLPVTPVTHIRWYDALVPTETQATVEFAARVRPLLPPGTTIQNMAHISSTETAAWFHEWIPSNQVEVETTMPGVAVISGAVFEDVDGDGVQGIDEWGIADITITMDGVITTSTGTDGSYMFSTTIPGMHTVRETNPKAASPNVRIESRMSAGVPSVVSRRTTPGLMHQVWGPTDLPDYFSTTPSQVHVDVELGNSYQVDFGNARTDAGFASVHGTVFSDTDGDGLQDATERGIADTSITLDGAITTTTDLYGRYSFTTTAPGVHVVQESDPDHYMSTTPNEVHIDVAVGHGYLLDFGDAPAGSGFVPVFGTVFSDDNGDGTYDRDEIGIPGATVTLDGAPGVISGPYGGYVLSTTATGSHTVTETDLDGYLSTTPNEVPIDVALGSNPQVDFGDLWIQPLTCDADIYEEDDSPSQAKMFDVNTIQAHQFCDDATDWVKFFAQANSVYTITTSSYGQRADSRLTLFDTDGVTVLAVNDDYHGALDYSSRIVWMAQADDTYYVCITNQGEMTGRFTDYGLMIQGRDPTIIYLPLVTRSYDTVQSEHAPAYSQASHVKRPSGVISHTCPDAYEADDTWAQARAIEAGVVQVHSFDSDPLYFVADKDFVKLDISERLALTFTIPVVTSTATVMELFDERGRSLLVTGTTELTWMPRTNGRYYLSVRPAAGIGSFGCADTVGYHLLMEERDLRVVYLPMVVRYV